MATVVPAEGVILDRLLDSTPDPGDIIVMRDRHYIDLVADRRYAVEAMQRLIVAVRTTGFAFSSLCTDYRPPA